MYENFYQGFTAGKIFILYDMRQGVRSKCNSGASREAFAICLKCFQRQRVSASALVQVQPVRASPFIQAQAVRLSPFVAIVGSGSPGGLPHFIFYGFEPFSDCSRHTIKCSQRQRVSASAFIQAQAVRLSPFVLIRKVRTR
jgi:hypothetical protein